MIGSRYLLVLALLSTTLLAQPARAGGARGDRFRTLHAETASERAAFSQLARESHFPERNRWAMENGWRNARKWIAEEAGARMAEMVRFPLPDAGQLVGSTHDAMLTRQEFIEGFSRLFGPALRHAALGIDEETLELEEDGSFTVLLHTEDEFTLILRFRCYGDDCFLERMSGAG